MNRPDRREVLSQLVDRLDGVRSAPGSVPSAQAFREGVRDLVVVASSSRGGSSVVSEILRHASDALHFRAEVNPFFVLGGLDPAQSGTGCDFLSAADLHATTKVDRLLGEMSMDLGRGRSDLSDDPELEAFGRDLVRRLSIQWPLVVFQENRVREDARATYRELVDHHGWVDGEFPDARLFHVIFLGKVAETHPEVNAYYYDLSPNLIERWIPDLVVPTGPPGPVIVEEPPFVCIRPWRPASLDELQRMPVIVKTPSNVHRWDFLRGLFPSARIRVFHLTRNAAASINGLVDGWRYNGFYSHRSSNPLRIAGYSDRTGPFGEHWWKFDVPPGWEDFAERPLVEVCAYQWLTAHQGTLEFLSSSGVEVHRARFEELVGDVENRECSFERLTDWLGIEYAGRLREVIREGLPPVMATGRPRSRRWYDRAALLGPVLETDDIGKMMERLGYERDLDTWT